MFQWIDEQGITRFDCSECGATLELDRNKGLICPHGCEVEYNHPYPEMADDFIEHVITGPVWRTEWKDGQVSATHPVGCQCFGCQILMN